MIESFIKQTTEMLSSSNIRIHQPEIRNVIYQDDGVPMVSGSYGDHLFGRSNLADNLILQLMLFFGIIDAKIDTIYPALEDERFNKKYNALPQNNDFEVILKELYRMLILLRNASVHNKEALSIHNNEIVCTSGIKEFTLTRLGLEFIYTVVFLIINPLTTNQEYNLGILRRYYDEIITNVIVFKDANGEGLSDISNEIRLQFVVRYEIKNPTYSLDENTLTIFKPYDTGSKNYGTDYFIHIEGQDYVVPSEALNPLNNISKKDLQLWRKDK